MGILYAQSCRRVTRAFGVRPGVLAASVVWTTFVLLLAVSVSAQTAPQQKLYASPDEALADLVAAAKTEDRARLREIFGPDVQELLTPDPVQQSQEFASFTSDVAVKTNLVKVDDSRYTFTVGDYDHQFPVPVVRSGDRWRFDTRAGVDELLTRRIGEDETKTILACRAYAAAQLDYFQDGDWDNDLVQEFAQKFISSPGQKDGLYWPTSSLEDPSPLGPLVVRAAYEGYSRKRDAQGNMQQTPYHGYYFRILKAQGSHAPGGAHGYVTNGNMIGGFALVAYPAKYGATGVMTFIVNQQGRVYEKNLGANTAAVAAAMSTYDPDPTWKPTAEQE
jgi:hypothetical protein